MKKILPVKTVSRNSKSISRRVDQSPAPNAEYWSRWETAETKEEAIRLWLETYSRAGHESRLSSEEWIKERLSRSRNKWVILYG